MHQSSLGASALAACGSTGATLMLLGLLVLGITAGYVFEAAGPVALGLPMALLAVNLVAAVATRPVFRRQVPLLVAHLALLALVGLVGVGQLSRLQGRLELTEGVPFDGELLDVEAGPLHRADLARATFVNDGFDIDYAPGLKRGSTRNRVRWRDEQGRERSTVIGDHHPLVLHGYRFYTTPNKGFAPVFRWQPRAGGATVVGAVHLPSYPAQALRQARAWTLPDGTEVWIKLWSEETLVDPERSSMWQRPRVADVIVRVGSLRRVLAPGANLELPGGTLAYAGLRTWMGYRVFHDWTLPWLLAASTLAALALGAHFWLRFRQRPWETPAPAAAPDADARPVFGVAQVEP